MAIERTDWERLIDEGETARKYAYFAAYRDMEPKKRSIDMVAKDTGKSVEYLQALSRQYRWNQRVEKFDDFVDHKMRAEGMKRAERIRLSSLALSEKMLTLAEQSLDAKSASQLSVRETREYIKAAVALAEVYKDDNAKQRDWLDHEDTGADVVIYLPEIEGSGSEGE